MLKYKRFLEDTWNNFECDYFKTRQKWGKNDWLTFGL